jgi:hypothetical protein
MSKRPGRPRTLDRKKKSQICDLVAGGAKLAEAAVASGVSVRTIQRQVLRDPEFDHALRSAQAAPAEPLKLMQSAARTHWRAAAWLLEREDPERYGRRPASSCSPRQFNEALRTVLEAALMYAPPAVRSELFDHLERACEAAFQTVFPQIDRWGGRRQPQLPPTPLADQEKQQQICQSRRRPAIQDYDDAPPNARADELLRNSRPILQKSNPDDPPAANGDANAARACRIERRDPGARESFLSPKTRFTTKSSRLAPRADLSRSERPTIGEGGGQAPLAPQAAPIEPDPGDTKYLLAPRADLSRSERPTELEPRGANNGDAHYQR